MSSLELQITALPREYPGLDALTPPVVYLMGCRKFDQFCCTWRALVDPDKYCPFCPTELKRRGRNPLRVQGGWMILENEFPRPDVEQMLLIVPKRHILDEDLTDEDCLDRGFLEALCRRELGFSGGAFVMRDGDPRDHSGTIPHVHENAIRPRRESGMSVPLTKMVEGGYGHREDYVRLRRFVCEMNEKGGTDWLFSEKGVLETQPSLIKK